MALFIKEEHIHEHYHESEEVAKQRRREAEAEERIARAEARIARFKNWESFWLTIRSIIKPSSDEDNEEMRMKHEERMMLLEKDPETYKKMVDRENKIKIIKIIAIVVIFFILLIMISNC